MDDMVWESEQWNWQEAADRLMGKEALRYSFEKAAEQLGYWECAEKKIVLVGDFKRLGPYVVVEPNEFARTAAYAFMIRIMELSVPILTLRLQYGWHIVTRLSAIVRNPAGGCA